MDAERPMQDFYRYWGKAKAERDRQSVPCHLLPYHSLDVAAVGLKLLNGNPGMTSDLAQQLDMRVGTFRELFVFSLALHDLGKFARAFQGLAEPEGCDLVRPVAAKQYRQRHDALGALVWQ